MTKLLKKKKQNLKRVSIPPAPEVKTVKRDDGSVYRYVESVVPLITQPTVSNEEVDDKYKQLLDKIELSKDSLGWYLKVGTEREYTPFEVYNILKELKSIG